MPLKGPNEADLQKIHSEVNQLVNQRLSIATLSVTVFAVMIVWLTPQSSPDPKNNLDWFIYFGSILLLIVLFSLFLLTYHLSVMLRLFTSYLEVSGASDWEKDWYQYRTKFDYLGYTRPQTYIFLLLGFLTMIYPWIITRVYSLPFDYRVILCLISGILYLILVYGMGVKKWFYREYEMKQKWNELKSGKRTS
jgi:hypothetical protein